MGRRGDSLSRPPAIGLKTPGEACLAPTVDADAGDSGPIWTWSRDVLNIPLVCSENKPRGNFVARFVLGWFNFWAWFKCTENGVTTIRSNIRCSRTGGFDRNSRSLPFAYRFVAIPSVCLAAKVKPAPTQARWCNPDLNHAFFIHWNENCLSFQGIQKTLKYPYLQRHTLKKTVVFPSHM